MLLYNTNIVSVCYSVAVTIAYHLKGHCHAIWQLYEKAKKVSSHQLNSKTNDLVLLLKTISRYGNCFLSSVATDGTDGYGLKLEKIGHFFQVLMLRVSKIL